MSLPRALLASLLLSGLLHAALVGWWPGSGTERLAQPSGRLAVQLVSAPSVAVPDQPLPEVSQQPLPVAPAPTPQKSEPARSQHIEPTPRIAATAPAKSLPSAKPADATPVPSIPPVRPSTHPLAIEPKPAPATQQLASAAAVASLALQPPGLEGIDNPPPHYPSRARRRGQQGLVLLQVRVDAKGAVESVEIGDSSGHRLLDRAALDAVRQWRFHPARRAGEPVAAPVEVPVRFRLTDAGHG